VGVDDGILVDGLKDGFFVGVKLGAAVVGITVGFQDGANCAPFISLPSATSIWCIFP
jgi:hypothetical protein